MVTAAMTLEGHGSDKGADCRSTLRVFTGRSSNQASARGRPGPASSLSTAVTTT
jgi:hypothetical protein